MCDRCTELDERIEHYHVLLVRIRDPQTVEAIAALIDRLRRRRLTSMPPKDRRD